MVTNRTVYLFISYDLANSTEYKVFNPEKWPETLRKIIDDLRIVVPEKISGAQLWRPIGDEVIFVLSLSGEPELLHKIKLAYDVLQSQRKVIEKMAPDWNTDNKSKYLSLQATAWIALVRHPDDFLENEEFMAYDCLFEKYATPENQIIYDFVGNDIDAGFRVKQNASPGKLLLSYETARIITESDDYRQGVTGAQIQKVKDIALKGIWGGRAYPILEYSYSIDEANCQESTGNKVPGIVTTLQNIGTKEELENKILLFRRILQQEISHKAMPVSKDYYVHIAAVCFRVVDGISEILIVKRAKKRKKLGGKWEFGCAKVALEESISEVVKKEYINDFNIEIEPIMHSRRTDKEPRPLAIYAIPTEDAEKVNKGIIILAKVKDKCEPRLGNQGKHSSFCWVRETDINDFNDEAECVPDFKSTLIDAFSMINSLERNWNE